MIEKIKTQKGFIQIPLLVIIIAFVVVATGVGTGVVLQKQGKLSPLIANISEVFKGIEEATTLEEEEIKPEEPRKEQELGIGQEEISQQEQELEKASLEAEKARQEAEKARLEAEAAKAKAEAEKATQEARIKAEQELQRQLEAQRLAEEQRQKEIARQQELELQRQLEEQRQKELELQQAINQLKNLCVQKLDEYNSQLSSLNEQILAKENEINSIIEEYDKKIEDNRNKPILWSLIIGREANLIRERNEKLEPLYRELQSLENQYNRLVGSPIISNPYSYSISNNYWQFTPSGNGGILSDSLGNYYQVTYYPDGSFIISP